MSKVIVEFEILEEVGRGFHSKVFKAKESQVGRIIAIKEIYTKKLKKNFYDEAILLNTSKHPNVIDLHYAGEDEEKEIIYLAMPLYKKGSLQNIIQGEHTIKELLKYTQGILNGLLHIHSKGILHLDLKPDNILISDNNESLISDFGVSMNFDLETSTVETDKLYPFLTPPELLINTTASIQTDVYQTGILLYLLFNQINLMEIVERFDFSKGNIGKTIKIIQKLIEEDKLYEKTFNLHLPEKIKTVILKCMCHNVNERYKSIEDVRNALSEIENDEKLLWSLKKENNNKIFTRTIDSKKEQYIINDSNEIIHIVLIHDKETKKEIINKALETIFI